MNTFTDWRPETPTAPPFPTLTAPVDPSCLTPTEIERLRSLVDACNPQYNTFARRERAFADLVEFVEQSRAS